MVTGLGWSASSGEPEIIAVGIGQRSGHSHSSGVSGSICGGRPMLRRQHRTTRATSSPSWIAHRMLDCAAALKSGSGKFQHTMMTSGPIIRQVGQRDQHLIVKRAYVVVPFFGWRTSSLGDFVWTE